MRHWLAVVIIAGLIVLWYIWQPVRADDECLLMARTVEVLELTDAAEQKAQLAEWLAMTQGNMEAQRAIMSAVNWHERGQTASEAWATCESF